MQGVAPVLVLISNEDNGRGYCLQSRQAGSDDSRRSQQTVELGAEVHNGKRSQWQG